MLEPPARDQHAGFDQRLDHRLVGVALLAGLGDDALTGEPRRLLGEAAVGVDGVGDDGVDAARRKLARVCRPYIEVLAAVTRRGVDEAGAGILRDVIANQQRYLKFVTGNCTSKRMKAAEIAKISFDRARIY